MDNESELLVGMSGDELEALADGKLAPSAQVRLDELLARQAEDLLRVMRGDDETAKKLRNRESRVIARH